MSNNDNTRLLAENKDLRERLLSVKEKMREHLSSVIDDVRNTFREETDRQEERYRSIESAAKDLEKETTTRLREALRVVDDCKQTLETAIGSLEQAFSKMTDFRTVDERVRNAVAKRGDELLESVGSEVERAREDGLLYDSTADISEALKMREAKLLEREEALEERERSVSEREEKVSEREHDIEEKEQKIGSIEKEEELNTGSDFFQVLENDLDDGLDKETPVITTESAEPYNDPVQTESVGREVLPEAQKEEPNQGRKPRWNFFYSDRNKDEGPVR